MIFRYLKSRAAPIACAALLATIEFMPVEKVLKRRTRTWAVTSAAMGKLKRGAMMLAKKSGSRLAEPAVKKQMARLRGLMAIERACRLRQGDLLVELIDGLRSSAHRYRSGDASAAQ